MTNVTGSKARPAPIHFSSKEEFEVRPSYLPALRCTSDDLDYIVGKYGFSSDKKLRCGLNGCNREHWHGFVIATKSGSETHCGQDCGKREFNVRWDDLHAEFQRQEKALVRKALVSNLLQDRNQLLDQAMALQVDLSAACSRVRAIYDELRKEPDVARQFEAAMQNGGRILAEVKVDSNVGAASGQRGSNANIAAIGRIFGYLAAQKYQSAGRNFDWGVMRPLLGLTESSVDVMSDDKIAEKAKTVQSIRLELALAVEFVSASEQFLSSKNFVEIEKIKQILPSRAKTARLERIFSRLPGLFNS